MKNNIKNSKKITILLALIVSIVIIFFLISKFQYNKNKGNNDIKNNSIIKTEELNKSDGKASDGSASTVKGKSGEKVASSDNKDNKNSKDNKEKEKDKANNKEALTIFIKPANFGSTAEIIIDSSNFNSSYKYYQFFLENKPISSIESVTKNETTIFPAQEAGSEVVLKLLDENKKVLKELKVKLNDKK